MQKNVERLLPSVVTDEEQNNVQNQKVKNCIHKESEAPNEICDKKKVRENKN